MDNEIKHTRIIIYSSEEQTIVNYEVGDKLYPIATLHKTGDKVGTVTVDDRTNSRIVYNIGSLLQLFGDSIKIALDNRDLTQNKPQDD